jgi:hypothetical protein
MILISHQSTAVFVLIKSFGMKDQIGGKRKCGLVPEKFQTSLMTMARMC